MKGAACPFGLLSSPRTPKKSLAILLIVYTISLMEIAYDPTKSEKNIRERGLSFGMVEGFDWDSALLAEDTRKIYIERRFEAVGWIDERLYVVIFTPIANGVRIISFRKANPREVRRYEKTQS